MRKTTLFGVGLALLSVGPVQAADLAALRENGLLGVSLTVQGDTLVIEDDGVPNHATGAFPMMRDGNGDGRPDNPNRIQAQNYRFVVPLHPEPAAHTTPLPMGPVAISLGGVVFYNAYTAERTDAVINEVFDDCKGHPDMRGRYHYHQFSPCAPSMPPSSDGHVGLMGWAFDGFELYGMAAPHDGALDECQGHNDTARGYHYHMKAAFPYVMGCYRGTSTVKEGPGGQGMRPGQGGGIMNGRPPRPPRPNGARKGPPPPWH